MTMSLLLHFSKPARKLICLCCIAASFAENHFALATLQQASLKTILPLLHYSKSPWNLICPCYNLTSSPETNSAFNWTLPPIASQLFIRHRLYLKENACRRVGVDSWRYKADSFSFDIDSFWRKNACRRVCDDSFSNKKVFWKYNADSIFIWRRIYFIYATMYLEIIPVKKDYKISNLFNFVGFQIQYR